MSKIRPIDFNRYFISSWKNVYVKFKSSTVDNVLISDSCGSPSGVSSLPLVNPSLITVEDAIVKCIRFGKSFLSSGILYYCVIYFNYK